SVENQRPDWVLVEPVGTCRSSREPAKILGKTAKFIRKYLTVDDTTGFGRVKTCFRPDR
ncbi:hypothetical protein GWI33_012430, partial [Rhynchophorus ferrugineus]